LWTKLWWLLYKPLQVETTLRLETPGIVNALRLARYLAEHATEILRQQSPSLGIDSQTL
jgi:hypothetical protein